MKRTAWTYGAEDGQPLEAVCQEILDDFLGPGAVTLRVEEETGLAVLPWKVESPPRTVLDVIRLCADVAGVGGWEVVVTPERGYTLRPMHADDLPWDGLLNAPRDA